MTRHRRLGTITALVTLAVLGSAGGAAATWSASVSVSASASSATIATQMQLTGGLSTSYRFTDTASTAASGQLTITNSGGAPLSYTLASQITGSSVLAQHTVLRLWTGSCGATAPSGAVATTLADTAPTLPEAARTLAAGASVVVCVSTQIAGASNASLQGQTTSATFRATGAVGTSWTTAAGAATVAQSVYRLAAAGTPTCVRNPPREAELSWAAPANRTPGATLSYRVFDTASGATVATVSSASATVSVDLTGNAIAANGTYSLSIEAKEVAESGTTAPASSPVTVTRSSNGSQQIRYHCS